jgi:hypothetical protein
MPVRSVSLPLLPKAIEATEPIANIDSKCITLRYTLLSHKYFVLFKSIKMYIFQRLLLTIKTWLAIPEGDETKSILASLRLLKEGTILLGKGA